MKNMVKLFGIIAFIAVIGFAFIACKEEADHPTDEETSGRLTITGLSAYNGKYAYGFTNDSTLEALAIKDTYSGNNKYGLISNGSVTLKVWKLTDQRYGKNYTGNDQVDFLVQILSDETYIHLVTESIMTGTVTVNFANGIASGAFVAD